MAHVASGDGTVATTHTFADALGAGRHELHDIQDRLAVRYRVDVELVRGDQVVATAPSG